MAQPSKDHAKSEELVGAGPIRDAQYHDLARRLLQQQTRREICRGLDIAERTLYRYLKDPDFNEVYEMARRSLFEDVDGLIRDEKAQVALRRTALASRSLTLLAEVQQAALDHFGQLKEHDDHMGNAKSTVMKAGVEAARLGLEGLGDEDRKGTNINIGVFTMPGKAAQVTKQAEVEAAVDMSDLVDLQPQLDGSYAAEETSDAEVSAHEGRGDGVRDQDAEAQ